MKDDDTLKELNFNGIYKWSESKGIELLSKYETSKWNYSFEKR